MTLEDTVNEYDQLRQMRLPSGNHWYNNDETSRIYLAHCFNQLSGTLMMLMKELKKDDER